MFSQAERDERSKDRGIDRKRLGLWGFFFCDHDRLLAMLVSSHLGIIGVFRLARHIWQLLRPVTLTPHSTTFLSFKRRPFKNIYTHTHTHTHTHTPQLRINEWLDETELLLYLILFPIVHYIFVNLTRQKVNKMDKIIIILIE